VSAPEPVRRRTGLTAALILAAVFVAGAVAGSAATRAHDHWAVLHAGMRMVHGPPGGDDLFAPAGALGRRLKLTPAQHDSIGRIVASERGRARAFMRQMRPRLEAHLDTTTRAIEAVLTPAQRTEFARLRAEYALDMHHRAMEAVHGMHPPPIR
jgi:Spy/CpxP family protein refolding chaperone